jgi:lipoyl(octanoyl) transferase
VYNADKDCFVVYLGLIDYAQALELQMQLCRAKREGFAPDVLLLLEHPHTITLGRNAKRVNLLVSETELNSRGVRLFNTDRGGDITYHGPGQLVGYPIIQLEKGERDVHQYMFDLEESLIRLLALHNIEGGRSEGMTGVWCKGKKIASMGVHISRWITRHGFALNISTDLSFFRLIIACGLVDKQMTSMQEMLGARLELPDVAEQYATEFAYAFHRRITRISEDELCREAHLYFEAAPAV